MTPYKGHFALPAAPASENRPAARRCQAFGRESAPEVAEVKLDPKPAAKSAPAIPTHKPAAPPSTTTSALQFSGCAPDIAIAAPNTYQTPIPRYRTATARNHQ